VTNAAICSLGTFAEGLYVVCVVPLVRPEKYASAIWQKKPLPATSANGRVTIAPPQVPVSAGSLIDAISTTRTVKHRITPERSFSFIDSPKGCNEIWRLAPVKAGLSAPLSDAVTIRGSSCLCRLLRPLAELFEAGYWY
jgi:hypothetical protein